MCAMGRIFEVRKHAMFARWNRMAKQFTRVAKDIAIAVHAGGPDPAANPTLRRGLAEAPPAHMRQEQTAPANHRAPGQEATTYAEDLFDGVAAHRVGPFGDNAAAPP